ncbi:MAG: AAA family ATPase [Acidobacteriota bacterium]
MPENVKEFAITNVGAVGSLDIKLRPGVTVLRGPNGAGKTTAIKAITRASGGGGSLEPKRGAKAGSVRGPGVVLSIGKKVTSTGDPVVSLGDYGELAALIDPKRKGKEAAAKRRLEALLNLVPVEVTDDLFLELAAGDEEVAGGAEFRGASLDLLAAAELIRRTANAVAKDHETRRDQADGAAAAARERLETYDTSSVDKAKSSVEELQEVARTAVRDLTRTRDRREAFETLQARRLEIQASLGARPEYEPVRELYKEQKALVAALKEELRQAEIEEARLLAAGNELHKQLLEWTERKKVLDAPIEGTTAEDVEAAEEAARQAEEDVQVAREASEIQGLRFEIEEAEKGKEASAERAAALRSIAQSVWARIADALESSTDLPEGLLIDDGALCYVKPGTGEMVAFDELSLGQRTRLALEVALAAGDGDVLPLDPGFWAALQPERQREIATAAAERGAYLLTEAPADEPGIREEHIA